jgi:class 3 adenylate cyclase
MRRPETRYASVSGSDVAYQIAGDGPFDLLYCIGIGSNIELIWDARLPREFFTQLASFSRLILFDRRGAGASDPIPNDALPPWEDWSEDIRAVLDAAGSERAAIVGEAEAGAMAVLFAVTHPQRIRGLGLLNTTARYLAADDYKIGLDPGFVDIGVDFLKTYWGTRAMAEYIFGSLAAEDSHFVESWTQQVRAAMTPNTAATQWRHIVETVDVRGVLGLVQAPTIVMHHRDDQIIPFSHGQYLAANIPGATFVDWPGMTDHENMGEVAEELGLFLTGQRHGFEIERILTTILFTDIVGSTERAAGLGDRRWRQLLDAHDAAVRKMLGDHRGREIKTTGDGFMACFDGPGRAIRCAQAVTAAGSELGLDIRTGLHTGECEMRGDDIGGLAVHIAARIGALAGPGEVLVSSTVKDLVIGSGITMQERGDVELKGVPESWHLFVVDG